MDQVFSGQPEGPVATPDAVVKAFIYGSISKFRDKKTVSSQTEKEPITFPGTDLTGENFHIDLTLANTFENMNDFFRGVNRKLPLTGIFVGCFENTVVRSSHKQRQVPDFQRLEEESLSIHHDSLINRDSSLANTQKRKRKCYSLAEVLGRLAYCGFETVNYNVVGHHTYFVARKKDEPSHQGDPSYKLLMRMKRVGKNGKIIGVYKVRTMYPYSEYIHDFVVNKNGYNAVGKPSEDFRITYWGKFMRKFWIDETPQVINLLKGEMNLVGVRPITRFGYSSLPSELQQERIKYKPGLIPPNIALGKKGFHGVIEAETIYLREMEKSPLRTNVRYFFKAIFKIFTLNAKGSA